MSPPVLPEQLGAGAQQSAAASQHDLLNSLGILSLGNLISGSLSDLAGQHCCAHESHPDPIIEEKRPAWAVSAARAIAAVMARAAQSFMASS